MDVKDLGEGFEETERQMDRLLDVTDRLTRGPLDKLIDNLAKTADTSKTVNQSLEKFSEDLLKAFTRSAVEHVFEGIGPDGRAPQSGQGFAGNIAGAFLPQIFGGQNTSGVQVTVHNNAQATAQVQERVNSRGQREIEIMIDNMVASSLAQGNQTRSVLSSIFGIENLLKSR